MKTTFLVLLLCPALLIACGSPQSPATRSKSQTSAESGKGKNADSNTKDSKNTEHSNDNGQAQADDEAAVPPQPLTGIFLACVKPSLEDAVMNIDCALNNAEKERVKAADIADKVVYGVTSTKKDDDVLISSVEGSPSESYDVRYQVRAKDVSKIEKIIDSTTFFAKAYDTEGQEIKDAVKPFFGFDLELPSMDEMKKAFQDKATDILDNLPDLPF